MPQNIINHGAFLNDPSAEKVYEAFIKTNLNFNELYNLAGFQGIRVYDLDLTGIDTNQSEESYVADAVTRGQAEVNGVRPPFTCNVGQMMKFRTTIDISDDENVSQVLVREYFLNLAYTSIGGDLDSTVLNASHISLGGDKKLFELDPSNDWVIDLGNVTSLVHTQFNAGDPDNGNAPWDVEGLTFVIGTVGGVPNTWNLVCGDGSWGGVGNSNQTTAEMFINLNAQPETSTSPLSRIIKNIKSNYTLNGLDNTSNCQVFRDVSGEPVITITIPLYTPLATPDPSSAIPFGAYYDFFRRDATYTPLLVAEAGVTVLAETGDTLSFKEINTGFRLTKIGENTWLFVRKTGGSTSNVDYSTAITSTGNVAFSSTHEGLNKITPLTNADSYTIDEGNLPLNSMVIIDNRKSDSDIELLPETVNVRFRGIRDIDNKFLIPPNKMAFLLGIGNNEIRVEGCKSGYTGPIVTSSYGSLTEGDTNQAVTVIGTGFSANMKAPVITGNATLVSWVYVNNNQITLFLTATGVSGDNITVSYDNGDITTDVDAITIQDVFSIEDMSNLVEYWKEGVGDNDTGTATKTGVNGKVLSASGEGNPTLTSNEWVFDGVNDGFRIVDADVNVALNSFNFQLHVIGSFKSSGNTRICCHSNLNTGSGNSANNLAYRLLSNDNFNINIGSDNTSGYNQDTGINLTDSQDYLISMRFYDDSGKKVDIYIDDGTNIQSSLNNDASSLTGNFVANTFFVGMREFGSSQYYNVGMKSIVIASGGADFDNVKNELAL